MTFSNLVSRLTSLKIGVSVRGGRLIIDSPKGLLTPELKAELAAHKPALVALFEPEFKYWTAPNLTPREVRTLEAIVGDPWPELSLAESIELGRKWNADVRTLPHRRKWELPKDPVVEEQVRQIKRARQAAERRAKAEANAEAKARPRTSQQPSVDS
jgi:hypothetical protein